ncbi:MAG: TIGR03088 family PEP-CTERM/XrtA system glycosyltransferase [Propionivibrio sp.]
MLRIKMTADSRPLVLHVIHHLVTGGLENGLVNLINQLPESRFRHAVVCIEDYSSFRDRITRADVEVVSLHRSQVGLWNLRLAIYHLCRRLRPAIVHSRNQSGLDALLPARLAGVRCCIHGEHGWDVDDLDGGKWKPRLLRRLHSPLVHRYITVSRHLEQYLVNRVGIAPNRISQIYNGVDLARFAQREGDRYASLPQGFVGDDSVVIGTVGRLQPVKDQATLLRAFAALENASARLVMVGDGPLAANLRSLADSLGVGSRVWFSGALDDVPAMLGNIDVFVLPSLSEGISNTVLEAMASGIPVLATAVGGNVELVEDGRSGRLFQPGDAARLTQLLAAYLDDPDLRARHGAAGRDLVIERFSLAGMVASYQSIYEKFCCQGSR